MTDRYCRNPRCREALDIIPWLPFQARLCPSCRLAVRFGLAGGSVLAFALSVLYHFLASYRP